MAPAKRRAGGAKPAGKAPPHSLVTFAVNQGVDIEHARAQLNAFAEKYGAMMDTTAREALKHITADGLGPEYVEHCVATSSLREIRESQSQRSDGDRPAEGSPPAEPPRDTTERGAQIPPGAQIAPDPPPPSDPDSDSESLGVRARNERRRAEAAADRLPAAPRAAPRRAREPPRRALIAESESEPEPDPDSDLSAEELSDAEDEDDESDSFVEKDDEEEEDDDEDKYVFSQADVADAFGEVIELDLSDDDDEDDDEVLAAALGRRRRGGVTDDVWGAGDPRGGARRGQIAGMISRDGAGSSNAANGKGKLPLNLTAGGTALGASTAMRGDARAAPALTGRSRGGTLEFGRGAQLAAMAGGVVPNGGGGRGFDEDSAETGTASRSPSAAAAAAERRRRAATHASSSRDAPTSNADLEALDDLDLCNLMVFGNASFRHEQRAIAEHSVGGAEARAPGRTVSC